ncbi:acyl CoA:acetate/3-ketoacid CoA transferase [Pseudonocardia sp. ICBG1034]|uniref:acyl CoA:acetate/3-ketoacid CoA transferase n=1 Tax=Pseudonocardia sp. ICBG1034 TaxID=2844381 RepID=UPI001CCBBB24|nr:CoA-transferase [Pseudonocardia sp. ICBG1034]
MELAADSVAHTRARNKVVTAAEAVALIRDDDTIVIEGFAGQCFAEELTLALEARFLQSGSPTGLTIAFAVAQGDRGGRGTEHLCYDGLLKSALGGHWGMSGRLGQMAVENRIQAYNLPQGVIAQLFRDTAAGKPGLLTKVGLGTFVDPRHGGGRINDVTTEDRVSLMEIDGEEYLFYKAFERLDVAFLRGTTADPDGNVTMEREALTLEARAVATAVHNKGGLVIVQVERIADSGVLKPHDVVIPGVLVDCVVVGRPEHHTQTWATGYSAAMSGELRVPLASIPPLPLDERKVIARRAAMELRPNSVVNLGIGMPEGLAAVAAEEGVLDLITLTAEPGVIGGMPLGGLDFGSAVNGQAILDQPAQFDFYDGGGLDAAFLGMAQVDVHGNVNVSRFGPKLAGSGGFINISQNAKQVLFLGTFLAPCRTRIEAGRIVVDDGVAAPKFLLDVEQRTFSGAYAAAEGKPVLFVTERCVFRLTPEGLELIEIAPGLDLERDVLAHVAFTPLINSDPVLMDGRIFLDAPMGLHHDLLTVPLEARFGYDPERNIFFLNMEGMTLRTQADVDEIYAEVDRRMAAIGHKVRVVVNYDNFDLSPELTDRYISAIRALSDRYYLGVTRYTTSSFMRLKLGGNLSDRGIAPYVYESRAEALGWLDDHQNP